MIVFTSSMAFFMVFAKTLSIIALNTMCLSSAEKRTVFLSGNLYVEVLAEHVGSSLDLVEL